MHIETEISIGELIDKLTILEIKSERISDIEKLKNINREKLILSACLSNVNISLEANRNKHTKELQELYQQLKKINEIIWDIEDQIRDCERRKDFGKEFIQLARGVYLNNDERAAIKRKINQLLNSEVIEEKSYTEYR